VDSLLKVGPGKTKKNPEKSLKSRGIFSQKRCMNPVIVSNNKWATGTLIVSNNKWATGMLIVSNNKWATGTLIVSNNKWATGMLISNSRVRTGHGILEKSWIFIL
jgi:hypothetical protein